MYILDRIIQDLEDAKGSVCTNMHGLLQVAIATVREVDRQIRLQRQINLRPTVVRKVDQPIVLNACELLSRYPDANPQDITDLSTAMSNILLFPDEPVSVSQLQVLSDRVDRLEDVITNGPHDNEFHEKVYGYLRMIVHKTIGQLLMEEAIDPDAYYETKEALLCQHIYSTIFPSFGLDEFADVPLDIDRSIVV